MSLFSPHLPDRTLADFFHNFGQLLGSGLPLTQGVRLLAEQTRHGALRRGLMEALADMEDGRGIRQSLDRTGQMLPPLALEMIAAGEASGTLDAVARQLADHYRWRQQLKRTLAASLAYPVLMLVVAIHVPFLVKLILENLQGGEHTAMRYLATWYGAIAGVFAVSVAVAKSPALRRAMSGAMLRAPAVGRYLKMVAVGNFLQAFALLTEAGLRFDESVERAASACGSEGFARRARPAAEAIRRGDSLLDALSHTGLFGVDTLAALSNAEQSGELTQTLRRLSAQYRDRIRDTSRWMARVATGLIYGGVMLYVIILILGFLMQYLDMLQEAGQW